MKSFLQFISESNDHYFHGTSDENAEHILKHGLDPKKSLYSGKVYMTTNHGMAQKYSKNGRGKLGTVLKIHKDAIEHQHVKHSGQGIVEYGAHIHPKHISKVE